MEMRHAKPGFHGIFVSFHFPSVLIKYKVWLVLKSLLRSQNLAENSIQTFKGRQQGLCSSVHEFIVATETVTCQNILSPPFSFSFHS